MRSITSLSLALASLAWAMSAHAYCPSYTASSSHNTHNCATEAAPGINPTIAEWQDIFSLVAKGPDAWGNQGPSLGTIGQGCGKPEPLTSVSARFPCELLKAIAMAESSWRQFCVPDRPADQVGGVSRTIISFDCGYGIGQVTSGMRTQDPEPNYDRERVASDPIYNLATGTQILASKWKATNCVGDNQPSIIEHWYAATWAYNGLAYVNNPVNPVHDANRGVYNPKVGGSAPYQEKVFGWIEHPPTTSHWSSVPLAYPNPGDVGTTGKPPDLPEPSCASPTDCLTTRVSHLSSCLGGDSPDGGTGGDTDAGSDTGTGESPDSGTGDGFPDASTWPNDDDIGSRPGRGGRSRDGGAGEMTSEAYTVSCSCKAAGGGRSGGVVGIGALALGVVLLSSRRGRSSPS